MQAMLDEVRRLAGINLRAEVQSENNFPSGAGIASSASAFAALALATSAAAGISLSEAELSRLARHGSGSACRSIPGGHSPTKHIRFALKIPYCLRLPIMIKYGLDILISDEKANPSRGGGAKSWICVDHTDRQTAESSPVLLSVFV